jgi:hypothetical protein
MHLRDILRKTNYIGYRMGFTMPNQNASAKEQIRILFKKRDDLIFTEGDKYSEKSRFYWSADTDDFSSMLVGGLCVHYVKDMDFENQILWGLCEYGMPPTLISPRPKISVRRFVDYNGEKVMRRITEERQSSMEVCLKNECHQDIFEALFNERAFEYDLTK